MENLDRSLSGDYEVTLDEAGRIAIPRYLRTILEKDQVVLTRGPNHCLWLYTAEDWKERLKTIVRIADPDTALGRDIRRQYIGSAHPLDMDKQGRILVPPSLREYAGLSRDCMVVGNHDYIEIWDKEQHKAYECGKDGFEEKSEAFAKEKERKGLNAGNNAHSGAAGTGSALPGAEGRE